MGAGVGVGETGTEAEERRAAEEEGRRLVAVEKPPEAIVGGSAEAKVEVDDFARGTPQSVHLAVVGL